MPAYNQFTFHTKSPERLRDEITQIFEKTGIDFFFGTDDNFFNNRETVAAVFTELAKGKVHGKPFRDHVVFGTEATEYDVHKNLDLLPLCREGGLQAIWFGIEDITAELVKKGQSPEKTKAVFEAMTRCGIMPMSMMMHHDGQPLASRGNLSRLLIFAGGSRAFYEPWDFVSRQKPWAFGDEKDTGPGGYSDHFPAGRAGLLTCGDFSDTPAGGN